MVPLKNKRHMKEVPCLSKMVQKGKGFNLSAKFLLRLCWVNSPRPTPTRLGPPTMLWKEIRIQFIFTISTVAAEEICFFFFFFIVSRESCFIFCRSTLSHRAFVKRYKDFLFQLVDFGTKFGGHFGSLAGYSKSKGDWELLKSAPLWPEIG